MLSSIKFDENTFIKVIIILSVLSLLSSGIYYLSEDKITFDQRINRDYPNRLNPVSSSAITYGNLCMTLFILNICALLSDCKIVKIYISWVNLIFIVMVLLNDSWFINWFSIISDIFTL